MPLPQPTPAHAEPGNPLERALQRVEQPLAALQQALQAGDLPALETHSQALHAQLARTVDVFMRSGRDAPLPAPLRHRLATAGARVAALHGALARRRAATAQGLGLLLPTDAATYGAQGVPAPRSAGGCAQA